MTRALDSDVQGLGFNPQPSANMSSQQKASPKLHSPVYYSSVCVRECLHTHTCLLFKCVCMQIPTPCPFSIKVSIYTYR